MVLSWNKTDSQIWFLFFLLYTSNIVLFYLKTLIILNLACVYSWKKYFLVFLVIITRLFVFKISLCELKLSTEDNQEQIKIILGCSTIKYIFSFISKQVKESEGCAVINCRRPKQSLRLQIQQKARAFGSQTLHFLFCLSTHALPPMQHDPLNIFFVAMQEMVKCQITFTRCFF